MEAIEGLSPVLEIKTCDMHVAGEPLRIFESHLPPLRDPSRHKVDEVHPLSERRALASRLWDRHRRVVIQEPRGHRGMYAAALVDPDSGCGEASFAALFLHNEGLSTMCGHAVLALARYAADRRRAPADQDFVIQCPCGPVTARYDRASRLSTFVSVPSFVLHLDKEVDVAGHGIVSLSVAFGGAFYAVLPASKLGLDIRQSPLAQIVHVATLVSKAVRDQLPIEHPTSPEMSFLYGTIVTDDNELSDEPTLNICVYADKAVDRCSTGSGVTARMALLHCRGESPVGKWRRFAGISGAEFTAAVCREVTGVGPHPAVTIRVSGRAFYTGTSTFLVEQDDIFPEGFLLRQ